MGETKINLNIDVPINQNENKSVSLSDMIKNVKNLNNNINNVNENNNKKVINEINKKINKINENNEDGKEIPTIKNIHIEEKDLFKPIGILDPEGKGLNPLTQQPYQNLYIEAEKFPNTYSGYAMGSKGWSEYKTYKDREQILTKLYKNQCVLITAGTGAGKTVLVPKLLLHIFNYQGNIAITIPRTKPTISAAEYSAKCLDVELGTHVGYSTQFDKKKSSQTKLLYTTDGTILAKLNGNDPYLENLDGLIIDEAHERNANIDQILLLVKDVLIKRPEFKFVIMSATIDPKIFLNYYKEFGIDHVDLPTKPNYNVNEIWLKEKINVLRDGKVINKDYIEKAAEIAWKEILLPKKEGDILILVPSPSSEADKVCQAIQNHIKEEKKKNPEFDTKPFCIKLEARSVKIPHGTLQNEKGDFYTESNYAVGNKDYRNLNKTYNKRIIVASDVAESSITFEGDNIDFVIDTGLANITKYYPNEQFDALEKKYIAKANHIQRKGRTGRKQEGVCYNVFTEEEYKQFLDWPIPKIMNENCISLVLSFMNKDYITHVDMPFTYPKKSTKKEKQSLNEYLLNLIGPPSEDYINSSLKQLELINAIEVKNNKGYITDFGRAIQIFERESIPPQYAASILHSYNYKCSDEVMNIVSLLIKVDNKFRDVFNDKFTKEKDKKSEKYKQDEKKYIEIMKKNASSYGDLITLHKILQTFKEKQYTIKREKGREVLLSKESEATGVQWAKDHFIRYENLKLAIKEDKKKKTIIQGVKKAFAMAIGRYRDVIKKDVIVHEKMEDRIIQSFVNGFSSNLIQLSGRDYINCMAKEKTSARVSNNQSLLKYMSTRPTLCLQNYYFNGIDGRREFGMVTKIPTKIQDTLSPKIKEYLKKCKKSDKLSFLKK